MAIKNFVVKNGLTVGLANIDAATGNLFSGNANLGNLAIANFFQGNANALFNIQGANVVGTVANANYSLYAGTVLTNAQPNITSVGTLSSLTVSGNASVGGIKTDNYYYANGSPVDFQQAAGSNTQIQFNNNNDFGASANFTFNTATDTLTVTGNANVSGHVNAANINSGSGALTLTANGQSTIFNANGIVAFPANVSAPNFIGNVVGNISGNLTVPGANTEVIFNDAGIAGASNAFTFNKSSNVLTVNGNISSQNANLGNLATANFVNVSSNLSVTGNIASGNINAGNLLTANFVTGTLTTAAQPNITSVGTLSSLDVSGNVGAGNVNGGNLVTANFIAGTLTTAAQPNITSLGNLSALEVTGNILTSANVVTDLIVGRTSGVTIAAAGSNQDIELKPSGTGTVDVWSKVISNVASPLASTDAATKGYVDAAVEGLHIHAPCAAATPNTLATISSGTVTYNNGTSGVGATLTTTGTYATIDGVNIATVGTRILVKSEANAAHNGIYTYTSSTVLTRATDFDTPTEMGGGDFTFVQAGTLYNDTGWVMTDPVTTVGTSNVNFVQFSGAGTYTAGTGLTLNGTEFSISNTAVTAGSYGNGDYVATFTVNAQGQLTAAANTAITANAANLSGTTLNANIVNSSLTSVGTLGSLAVSGNATAGNVYANSGTIGASLLAGTLTTAAQPNITSVGNLSSLNVTGNVVAGNFVGVLANGNSNVNIPAANGNVNISAVGVANVLVVTGTGVNVAGTLNATGNVTVGNLTTAGSGGNITGANVVSANTFLGNLQGILANGNSNVSIPSANGNVNISAVGTANVLVVTGTGVNVAGTLNATGNANVDNLGVGNSITATGNVSGGNLSTGGTLSVTGNANVGNLGTAQVLASANVTAPQFISNVANGTAPLTVLSSTLVANLNADLLDGFNSATANTANTIALRDANGNVSANYFTGNGAFLTGIDTSLIANGNSNVSVIANGNVTVSITGTANTAVFSTSGLDLSGNLLANVVKGNSQVQVGNTQIRVGEITTTATTANQTISTVSATGITGVEWLVKGVDSAGKYSVATITAVTDGSTVDYSIFGAVNIGTTPGTLAVNIVSGNIALQVTPSSSNSTVWVTQYRTI